jgi:SOS-response transcriptional repressor LexA
MLTKRQSDVLCLLESHIGDISPSYEEMATRLGLSSKSSIHRIVYALAERGYVRLLPGRSRAIEVVRRSKSSWPSEPPTGRDAAPYEALIARIRKAARDNGAVLSD